MSEASALNRSASAASHPMVPPAAGLPARADEPDPGQVVYQLVPQAPPVDPAEVDTAESTVEVVVMWGDYSILHVAHLSPPRGFVVGDAVDGNGKSQTDYLIGSESIGAVALPVTVECGDGVAVVIPPGAEGDVTIDEQQRSFEELAAAGHLQPCPQLAGAMQYPLGQGGTARVHHRGFTFVVRPMSAARKLGAGGAGFDWRSHIWTGAALLFNVALLVLFYFLPPSGGGLSLDLLTTDSRLHHYVLMPPAVETELPPDWEPADSKEPEGGTGERAVGDEGEAGDEEAQKTNDRFAIQGPKDNVEPQMANKVSMQDIVDNSIIGLLQSAVGAWNSPTSPFGAEQAIGNDPMSALGAITGDQIGSNFGIGGLGMRGTGRGGGGPGEGTIGQGTIGTIGHGDGRGGKSGYGTGAGNPLRDPTGKVPPKVRTLRAEVVGSLSKEVIRRVIRRQLNEVRFCYEQSLIQRPDLSGRVAIKFIISPTGEVRTAMVAKSTVAEPRVGHCIAKAVQRWNFPSPDGGGLVVVTYPFVLEHAGN